jgi:hypothetical protein
MQYTHQRPQHQGTESCPTTITKKKLLISNAVEQRPSEIKIPADPQLTSRCTEVVVILLCSQGSPLLLSTTIYRGSCLIPSSLISSKFYISFRSSNKSFYVLRITFPAHLTHVLHLSFYIAAEACKRTDRLGFYNKFLLYMYELLPSSVLRHVTSRECKGVSD